MSVFDRFANNAKSSLNSAVTSSGTVFSLISIASFPVPPFRATLGTEIVKVTGTLLSENFLYVTRGIENTVAAAHISGTMIANTLTKDALYNLAIDNSIANFTFSSSQTDPYSPTIANIFFLHPKNGNRISLIDPVESGWRSFCIESFSPAFGSATELAGKIVDVFAYCDTGTQRVSIYKTPAWSIDNPIGNRNTIKRLDGIEVLDSVGGSNNIYRYLNSYQVFEYSSINVAVFGWKRYSFATVDNHDVRHNRFSKIIVKGEWGNSIRSIEKGYDNQRLTIFNGSDSPIVINHNDILDTDWPAKSIDFAPFYCPKNNSFNLNMNSGIEFYFDAAYGVWKIMHISTVI